MSEHTHTSSKHTNASEQPLGGKRSLKKQPSSHPVLYLSNLPHSIAPSQIEDVFHQHAKIDVAHVELLVKGHGTSTKTCGLGVVTLSNPDPKHLDDVMKLMDGKVVMGRPMIVRRDKFEEDDYAYEPAVSKQAAAAVASAAQPQAAH